MANAWERFKGLFGSRPDTHGASLLSAIATRGSAPRRGSKEMLQAYKQLPWLHAVVHRIARDVGSTKWKLYRDTSRVTSGRKSFDGSGLEEVFSHAFLDVLNNPNPMLGRVGTFFLAQGFLEVKGEAPLIIERAKDGKALELWPAPPTWLQQLPTDAAPWFQFQANGWAAKIPESDVLWLREYDLENPYGRGTGAGDALSDELDIDKFATEHVKSWFYNRALPDAIVSVDGISKPEALRLEQDMVDKHQGTLKAGRIHVSNGKMSVQVLSQSFKEQQLQETRKAQRDTILQVYSMPPEVMGIIENSNRSTIDSAFYLYSRGVLVPRLEAMADKLTRLAKEWDPSLVVGFASPVEEDLAFKLQVMQAQPALFAKNEWRALAGAEAVAGWDSEYPSASAFPAFPSGQTEQPKQDKPEDSPAEGSEEEQVSEPKAHRHRGSVHLVTESTATKAKSTSDRLVDALKAEHFEKEVTPELEAAIARMGGKALKEIGSGLSFNIRNPLTEDYLDGWREVKLVGINRTTSDGIRGVIAKAQQAGLGIDAMADGITDLFDSISESRARLIARTEAVSSANGANLAAWELSGIVDGKEWLSAMGQSDPRPDHQAMNGRTAKMGDSFELPNGATASAPGQFGDPAEDCNCHCTILPKLDDKAAPLSPAVVYRSFMDDVETTDTQLLKAIRAAFEKQRADVMAALKA